MTLNRNLKFLLALNLMCLILIGSSGLGVSARFYPRHPEMSNVQLRWIEITGKGQWDKEKWRLFQKNPTALVKFDMGMEGPYENVRIRLNPKPGDTRKLKVEQQIETSMTISDEGPHLDLLNWKHGVSPWVELTSLQPDVFRGNPLTEKDMNRFPAYTREELYQAIIAQEKKNKMTYGDLYSQNEERWLRIVKQKPQGKYLPYSPEVSTIRLRIQAKEGDTWHVIHTVEIAVALGC
ncbi:MAG TPA: hypothetical protein PKE58_09920 [Acidobacteriota bacterium]|nr:hypothetical protein [Acidobacteriota bacterium]